MIRAIVRNGLLIGAATAAYYAARKYWGSDFDQAVDSLKSTATDIGRDITRKDKAVSSSFEEASRKAL